ncbi:MAG: TRAP transporter substrate-binding protein DctP [Angelakisella sp.]|nr:TRAP transporter substrate-binding protein DctP [Angelakisella sp.]
MKSIHRKALAVLLTVFMMLGMIACGGKTASPASGESSLEATFTPVVWRMANQHPEGSIAAVADQEVCDAIEKATEGRVKVTLYTNNALGDYLSVFDEIMVGSIEMGHISTNEAYDARLLGTFLPYLATGYNQLPKLYSPEGYLFKTLHDDIYSKLGIELMGFFCEGFDGICSMVELKDPAVIGAEKGCLLRVPGMQTFIECNLMLGFRTTTIPYSDTYTAMQTGLCDGASGVPANLGYLNFRDVMKYYYDYQQIQEATSYLINKKAYDLLLPEDQEVIRKVIQDKCVESFKLAQDDEQKYKDMLTAEGITVVEFTDEERSMFAKACHEKVWPKLAQTFTQEFLDGCLTDAQG